MIKLFLFDFDGTLTRRDTTRDLVLLLAAKRPWRLLGVLPQLLGLVVGRPSADQIQQLKTDVLAGLMAGMPAAQLRQLMTAFSGRVRPLIREAVMAHLRGRRDEGGHVLIVTASPRIAVEAALEREGVSVVGTEFDVVEGRLVGPVCYGRSKVQAVHSWQSRHAVGSVVVEAWTDSLSDWPMMELAERRIWISDTRGAAAIRAKDASATIFDGTLRAL